MMIHGHTRLSKDQRHRILQAHIEHAEAQNKELTKPEMLRLLRVAGYNISLATLYLDLDELARNDSFIVDLASKTYSKIMHEAFNRYNKIHDLAMGIFNADVHLSRTITRITDKGDSEETITEKSAQTKLQALSVAKQAQDSIRLMVNGENLRVSASKWVETSKQQALIIDDLKRKLKEYEAQIPQIKDGTNQSSFDTSSNPGSSQSGTG